MAVLAGYGGKVMVGTATVAELGEWSLDIALETEETTAFGSQWQTFKGTVKNWSGSASGRWDMTDTQGQKALQDALLGGTEVSLKFYVDNTHYYSGNALVTGISPSASATGIVEVSVDFQGTGPLTYS